MTLLVTILLLLGLHSMAWLQETSSAEAHEYLSVGEIAIFKSVTRWLSLAAAKPVYVTETTPESTRCW